MLAMMVAGQDLVAMFGGIRSARLPAARSCVLRMSAGAIKGRPTYRRAEKLILQPSKVIGVTQGVVLVMGRRLTGLTSFWLSKMSCLSLDVMDPSKAWSRCARGSLPSTVHPLLDETAPSVAVLDIKPVGDECGAVCQRLWERAGCVYLRPHRRTGARSLTMRPDVPVMRKLVSHAARWSTP